MMMGFILSCTTVSYLLLFGANALSVPNDTPQRQRRPRSNTRRVTSDNDSSSGPKSDSMKSRRRSRQPARKVFDPQKVTSDQKSNEDASALDLYDPSYEGDPSFIKRRSLSSVVQIFPTSDTNVLVNEERANDSIISDSDNEQCKGPEIAHAHFEYLSLDSLFPGIDFGKHFFTNGDFRQDIRVAMRKDIFFTTPAYADISPKVAAMMLDDDSSLQGTWNCIPKNLPKEEPAPPLRMTRLTKVLQETLGSDAPTGDDFMMALGGLCGENSSAHWIDIIGVKDREVSHSWHQDTGISYLGQDDLVSSRYTVMLGFPIENEYSGCGVFSHAIKLKHEHLAPYGHNENEPVLFEGTAADEFIIRPEFTLGQEILRYRDVDVLHSAPDAVYRQSVMRFM